MTCTVENNHAHIKIHDALEINVNDLLFLIFSIFSALRRIKYNPLPYSQPEFIKNKS